MSRQHCLPVLAAALAIGAASTLAAAPPASPAGAALFQQRCKVCHMVTPGARSTIGPNLAGVVGRKAASTEFRYSPALKGANVVWTPQNLDRFLTSPAKMVPGTRMVVSVTDARQRAELIKYLGTIR